MNKDKNRLVRVYGTVPEHLKELILREADSQRRSQADQVGFILEQWYREKREEDKEIQDK